MMQADTETTTAEPAVELLSSSGLWLQRLKAMRLQIVLFVLFGVVAQGHESHVWPFLKTQ